MARLLTLGLATLTLCGCGVFSKRDSTDKRDPLYGRYIPKTDLPIPSRDGKNPDPLFAPTSGSRKESDPYRPTSSTSVAGLAGTTVENSGLSMGDRRAPATPAKGVPLRPREPVKTEGWDDVAEELSELKARYDAPRRDTNGEYIMSATVPVGNDGILRRYEGSGRTPRDAAKALVRQIRNP